MEPKKDSGTLISLDVGEKRIGVATAHLPVRIATGLTTVHADGTEFEQIARIFRDERASKIIVGYPRNQSGEQTAQTTYVEAFARRLEPIGEVVFQDESLTSVLAEQQLKADGRPYDKADIDMRAATLILQDYLELA